MCGILGGNHSVWDYHKGIECMRYRGPLLSRKLVEFSFSLSEEDRCPKGEQKGLFMKAYEEEIGKNILYRKKQGFGMPNKYIGSKKAFQEYLLEDIWEVKL